MPHNSPEKHRSRKLCYSEINFLVRNSVQWNPVITTSAYAASRI